MINVHFIGDCPACHGVTEITAWCGNPPVSSVWECPECIGLIRTALDAAGYVDTDPTPENVISCFFDYVDAGVFSDLRGTSWDELIDDVNAGDITIKQICRALIRL